MVHVFLFCSLVGFEFYVAVYLRCSDDSAVGGSGVNQHLHRCHPRHPSHDQSDAQPCKCVVNSSLSCVNNGPKMWSGEQQQRRNRLISQSIY